MNETELDMIAENIYQAAYIDKGVTWRCDDCRFWESHDENDKLKILGHCHRYAPKPISYDAEITECPQIECGFPAVFGDEWCGEFRIKRE